MAPPILLALAFDVLVMAPLTAWLARERGRPWQPWFLLGAVAGPFALFAVGTAPRAAPMPAPEPTTREDPDRLSAPEQELEGGRRSRQAPAGGAAPDPAAPVTVSPELARTISALTLPTDRALGEQIAIAASSATPDPGQRPQRAIGPGSVILDPSGPVSVDPPRSRRTRERGAAMPDAPTDAAPSASTRGRPARPHAASPPAARPSAARPSAAKPPAARADRAPDGEGRTPAKTTNPLERVPPTRRAAASRAPKPTARPSPGDSSAPPVSRRALAPATPIPGGPAASREPTRTLAVFLGGGVGLTIGERYLVEVGDSELAVLGRSQGDAPNVKLAAPTESARLLPLEDGFVIVCEPTPGRPVELAFRSPNGSRLGGRLAPGQPSIELADQAAPATSARRADRSRR